MRPRVIVILLAGLIACVGRKEIPSTPAAVIAEAPSHFTGVDDAKESSALPGDAGTSNGTDAGLAVRHRYGDFIPRFAGKRACFVRHAYGAAPPLSPHGAAACARGPRPLEVVEEELVSAEEINDARDPHEPPDPALMLHTAVLYSEWECAEYQQCLLYRNNVWSAGAEGHVRGALYRRDQLCDELKRDYPYAAQCP